MYFFEFLFSFLVGGDSQSYGGTGRVISVKWGDYTRRVGIDGSAEAIKEAIKSAFRLRTRRAFWLEDEDQVVRSLDKNMPLGNYTLHLDEGTIVLRVCKAIKLICFQSSFIMIFCRES